MRTTIGTLIQKFELRAPLTTVVLAATFLAGGSTAIADAEQDHAGHGNNAPAKLVQLVRDATRQFINVNAATAAGYQPFLACVSGPDHGAMGVHYVNGALVGDSQNRYGLPAHFELHVWAWRDNPNGAFVDWNNNVSCEGQ